MADSFLNLSTLIDKGARIREALDPPSQIGELLLTEGDVLVYRWGRPFHRNLLPLAVVAGAWVDRPLAKRVFARVSLPTMLARVPDTDIHERRAIAAIGGMTSTGYSDATLFGGIVRRQAERLKAAFTIAVSPPDHHGVRPRAITRKDWTALPVADQVMVATVVGLYSGDGGARLMPGLRLPSAVDAAATMLDSEDELRADFLGLLAFYPGW